MKTQKHNRKIVILLILALVALYGFLPPLPQANAIDSIIHASDTISDSDVGATATHTFNFQVATTSAGGYWEIDFPNEPVFTGLATTSVTCAYGDANMVRSVFEASNIARCTATAQEDATSTGVTVTGITSTTTPGVRYIGITRYDSGGTVMQRVTVAVYIIDDVWMTAKVDSSLKFEIFGTSTAGIVGGIGCANASTATNTPFGTLVNDTPATVCQTLKVTTNAKDGFIVTIEQDGELTSDSGSNINSFDNSQDGTGSTTAHAWAVPKNILDNYHTYGHMGLFSDDVDVEVDGGPDFDNTGGGGGATWFAGLNGTDPMVVFSHSGPSDGGTPSKGIANILFQAEIESLQEAGDYESTLTYICTPTF